MAQISVALGEAEYRNISRIHDVTSPFMGCHQLRENFHFFDEQWDVATVRRHPQVTTEQPGFRNSGIGPTKRETPGDEDENCHPFSRFGVRG